MWNVLPNVNFLRFAVLELEAVTETRMDGRTDRRLMFLLDMGRRIINMCISVSMLLIGLTLGLVR